MATFKITTNDNIYTVDANNEEDARKIVEAELNPQTSTGLSSLDKSTEFNQKPTLIQQGIDATKSALTTPLPENIPMVGGQSVSQLATTAQRGMRGLGVGAENIINSIPGNALLPGGNISASDVANIVGATPNALQRAADAVQPGFVPQEGEKIGSFVGETLGAMPLATALTGGIVTPPSALLGKQAIFAALRSGGGGAALSAIEQASEKGNVDLADVALIGSTGALMPLIVPIGKGLMNVVKATVRNFPSVGTTLSKEAAGELMEDPKLIEKYAGTAKSIGDKVKGLQEGLVNHLKRIGDKLAEARANFNITEPFQDTLTRVANEGFTPKPVQDVMEDFINLDRGYKFTEKTKQGLELGGKQGMELLPKNMKEVIKENINSLDRISGLYKLRQDVGDLISYPQVRPDLPPVSSRNQSFLTDLYEKINDKVDSMIESGEAPKGAAMLRLTDKAYSQGRSLYDELQKKLSTEGQAEQVLMRIAKHDNPDEIIGTTGDVVDTIRRLEKATGNKYLDPLRKDFYSRNIKSLKSTPAGGILNVLSPGPLIEAGGPQSLSLGFSAVKNLTSVINNIIEAASRSNVVPSATSKLTR